MTVDERKELIVDRVGNADREGIRFDLSHLAVGGSRFSSTDSRSGETCAQVLLNSEMNVLQTPEGTVAEPWVVLWPIIRWSEINYHPDSPPTSLWMADEVDGSDTHVADEDWDYDLFGQAFVAPSNLSRLTVSFDAVYYRPNSVDTAYWNIWPVDQDGYLTSYPIRYEEIGGDNYWASHSFSLTSLELAQASGQTLALVFDLISDQVMTSPSSQVGSKAVNDDPWYDLGIYIDNAQVTVCYERGTNLVFLPLATKNFGSSSAPTCVPREPDSVSQMGKTAVGATCGGSFSALDEKDYYDLNLTTAASAQEAQANIPIRLRLFNLPNGTNWDAMIYQNSTGYPLACQIGTPGDSDKGKDCNLDSNKNYFVLVSRGPETAGGTYQMSVTRR